MELTLGKALQKAVEAHKAGQFQDAESLYASVLKHQPLHPDANHNMGVLSVSVGKVQKALPFFKIALKANPSVAQFWLSYIVALIKLGQITNAKAVFDQAKNNGVKVEDFYQLEELFSNENISEASLQNPTSEQFEPIVDLYNQGQFQQSLTEIAQMLMKFPDSFLLYNISGACYAGLMQYSAAIDSYKKAIKIKPDYAYTYNNMGVALKNLGDWEAAVDSYKKALTIKPDYAEAYYNIGIALETDLKSAIHSYKQAIRIKPDYAEAYNNIGLILKDTGDLEAAINNYEYALKIKPDYAEAYYNMGRALAEKGDLEPAINRYRQALKIKPDYSKVHHELGLLFFENAQFEKAGEYFRLSDFRTSKYYVLRCLYFQDNRIDFYHQLNHLINNREVHPMVGSLVCRSALRYGIDRPNLFCKDPLNYILQTELPNQYAFEKIFIKTVQTILNKPSIINRRQTLLTNGSQTFGNLFDLEHELTDHIQRIIRLEIKNYLVSFKDSEEGLITSWPSDYSLNGWLVSMNSGGELRPHMHENGWLSGSIYINVPPKSTAGSGNLVVCIGDKKLAGENLNNEKIINVTTGTLCLFPASLLHYTIPFDSEEERIVLAFDMVPKY